MEGVPTLQQFSTHTLIEGIVSEKSPCPSMKLQWQNLIKRLDQGSWGESSQCLLDRIIKFHSHNVTPTILEALLPANCKILNLKKCHLVTEECINRILKRSVDLRILNLSKITNLKLNRLDLFSFQSNVINFKLTTVILEGCPEVSDANIKALLQNAPLMVSLNVADCNISDNAFLLNGIPTFVENAQIKLQYVNLSDCKTFSSLGVHHLCLLCGQTLQSIDLLMTNVDCFSLLYLSGFGLSAAGHIADFICQDSQDDFDKAVALENTARIIKPKIRSLTLSASIFKAEKVGPRCFKQFLLANDTVETLAFHALSPEDDCITDDVLELIADHAKNLTSLTVSGSDCMTNFGVGKLAGCKQLQKIEFPDCRNFNDSAIIELIQSLDVSHLVLTERNVSSALLSAIASKNKPELLKQLDVYHTEESPQAVGLDNVLRTCTSLEKLSLKKCCFLPTTLDLFAANCRNITELNFLVHNGGISDDAVILMSKNLPLLEDINLGFDLILTDPPIQALLTNCKRLSKVGLFGLKITSAPFLQLITVPDELQTFLWDTVNKNSISYTVNLSELPCLPHRSMVYCTELTELYLSNCVLVEERDLQTLATVTHGSITIVMGDAEVQESVSSLERFIHSQMLFILQALPGFHRNSTGFGQGYFDSLLQKLGLLFRKCNFK